MRPSAPTISATSARVVESSPPPPSDDSATRIGASGLVDAPRGFGGNAAESGTVQSTTVPSEYVRRIHTCTRPNIRASFDNVATATGTPPTGPNVTATDTAPVKVAALTPAKKKVTKKKKPKVVSHKKPKATG